MEAFRAADALAKASSALVGETDIAGFLANLLTSSTDVLRLDAAGILVQDDGHLDVLAASSHTAIELELHQAQLEEGPCVDAHSSGEPVNASSADLSTRWPRFGRDHGRFWLPCGPCLAPAVARRRPGRDGDVPSVRRAPHA